jgi:hypothetical protein
VRGGILMECWWLWRLLLVVVRSTSRSIKLITVPVHTVHWSEERMTRTLKYSNKSQRGGRRLVPKFQNHSMYVVFTRSSSTDCTLHFQSLTTMLKMWSNSLRG